LSELSLLLLALLLAGWLAAADWRQRLLSAADELLEELLSCQFCRADGPWLAAFPAPAAVLLSTRPAKMSLPWGGSAAGLGRGGAL
jgi:hypothetical protein